MAKQDTVICHYRVRRGQEAAFEELLRRHWPTLDRLGLVVGEPSRIYRGEEGGAPIYYEIFTWKDGEQGSRQAHESPEVGEIWRAMGALVEERDGRPMFEFPHVTPLAV
ncbi:MAG: hypothetical protein H6807_05470 [Planctomycetes bacterium]|nr:hypothetical protein [Planctomycetota bacterium]